MTKSETHVKLIISLLIALREMVNDDEEYITSTSIIIFVRAKIDQLKYFVNIDLIERPATIWKGVKGIDTSERNGDVAAAFSVNEGDEVMLSTNKGRIIRWPVKQIRITGRNAKGNRIIKTSGEEKVVTAFKVINVKD